MSFDFDLVKTLYFLDKPVKTLYVDGKEQSLTCKIIYNANGAESGVAPAFQEALCGDTITLATNTGSLAKTGYLFDGWNTAADGSGTTYSVGSSYIVSGDVTLYAKWQQVYTVTFDTNINSSGNQYYISGQSWASGQQPTSTATKTINTGSSIGTFPSSVDIPSSNAKSYILSSVTYSIYILGWNTAADGSGTAVDTSTIPTENVTYYAIWKMVDNVNISSSITVPKFATSVSWTCYSNGGGRSAVSGSINTTNYVTCVMAAPGAARNSDSYTWTGDIGGKALTLASQSLTLNGVTRSVSTPGAGGAVASGSANLLIESTSAQSVTVFNSNNLKCIVSRPAITNMTSVWTATFYVGNTAVGSYNVATEAYVSLTFKKVYTLTSKQDTRSTTYASGVTGAADGAFGVTAVDSGTVSISAASGTGYQRTVTINA